MIAHMYIESVRPSRLPLGRFSHYFGLHTTSKFAEATTFIFRQNIAFDLD